RAHARGVAIAGIAVRATSAGGCSLALGFVVIWLSHNRRLLNAIVDLEVAFRPFRRRSRSKALRAMSLRLMPSRAAAWSTASSSSLVSRKESTVPCSSGRLSIGCIRLVVRQCLGIYTYLGARAQETKVCQRRGKRFPINADAEGGLTA